MKHKAEMGATTTEMKVQRTISIMLARTASSRFDDGSVEYFAGKLKKLLLEYKIKANVYQESEATEETHHTDLVLLLMQGSNLRQLTSAESNKLASLKRTHENTVALFIKNDGNPSIQGTSQIDPNSGYGTIRKRAYIVVMDDAMTRFIRPAGNNSQNIEQMVADLNWAMRGGAFKETEKSMTMQSKINTTVGVKYDGTIKIMLTSPGRANINIRAISRSLQTVLAKHGVPTEIFPTFAEDGEPPEGKTPDLVCYVLARVGTPSLTPEQSRHLKELGEKYSNLVLIFLKADNSGKVPTTYEYNKRNNDSGKPVRSYILASSSARFDDIIEVPNTGSSVILERFAEDLLQASQTGIFQMDAEAEQDTIMLKRKVAALEEKVAELEENISRILSERM